MQEIKPKLTSEIDNHCNGNDIAKADLFHIDTYNDLIKIVAELSFLNKENLLFYRGQSKDYLNQNGSTTIYPSIYRQNKIKKYELKASFEILDQIGKKLVTEVKNANFQGAKELQSKKYIQWSIIQHYEMWKTPLLDITHSLRVACTFAQLDNNNNYGVIYIFGLPYYSNRISINSEHDLVNIRLLSICPPSALRPYYQEGYLIGTTDIDYNYDDKSELDFKRRLVAKIKIPNSSSFWGKSESQLSKEFIYPNHDLFGNLCLSIKENLEEILEDSDYGALIKEWANLERQVLNKYKNSSNNMNINISQILRWLYENETLDNRQYIEINKIRNVKNKMIHEGYNNISKNEINEYIEIIKKYNNDILNKL